MRDPLVTVVVPMLNEVSSIVTCLGAIQANPVSMEILVVDGGSTDGSRDVVAALAARDPRIRVLENEHRLQAAAFNLALAGAKGTYLARVDARTTISADYLAKAIEVLERTGAVNAGGPIEAIGTNPFAESLAACYQSRFGLGHLRHDLGQPEAEVDTVSFGVWRIDRLRAVGGMDPWLAVNEDYELNYRLRAAGGKVIWNPGVRSRYQVRGNPLALIRQYLRYGFWKVRTLLKHPGSLRWRQMVAPAFALSLLLTPLLIWWLGPLLGTAHIIAYAIANLAASVIVASRSGWSHLLRLPLIFLIIHASWGFGFLGGLLHWPFKASDAR